MTRGLQGFGGDASEALSSMGAEIATIRETLSAWESAIYTLGADFGGIAAPPAEATAPAAAADADGGGADGGGGLALDDDDDAWGGGSTLRDWIDACAEALLLSHSHSREHARGPLRSPIAALL